MLGNDAEHGQTQHGQIQNGQDQHGQVQHGQVSAALASRNGLTGLLAPGAALERLAGGCTWSEGPLWLPDLGVVRWSDIPADRIMQVELATGEVSVHRIGVEFTNGRALGHDGSVVQCSHGRRRLEREVDGHLESLVEHWHGARLNSPNDVVVKSDGTIWFSDPPYGITLDAEGHPGDREYQDNFVFRLDPVSGELSVVVADVEEPNGLAFNPDESVLYVSDTSAAWSGDGTGNHHIRAYDVRDGRTCKNGRTIAVVDNGLPDGFAVDVGGNIWTSSRDAVIVLWPDGTTRGRIPVPEVVGNLCFGGPEGSDLFVAATTSLYRIATTTSCATGAAAAAAGR